MNVSVGLGERRPLGDAAVGTATHYYGSYTYRRAQPVDLLPPGQPGLVLVTNVEVDDEDRDGTDAPDADRTVVDWTLLDRPYHCQNAPRLPRVWRS